MKALSDTTINARAVGIGMTLAVLVISLDMAKADRVASAWEFI